MADDQHDVAWPDGDETPDQERREALRSIARFGAYVAPAMTVLIGTADAFHATPGHCAQNLTIKGCSTL